jgi:hypothetical protein
MLPVLDGFVYDSFPLDEHMLEILLNGQQALGGASSSPKDRLESSLIVLFQINVRFQCIQRQASWLYWPIVALTFGVDKNKCHKQMGNRLFTITRTFLSYRARYLQRLQQGKEHPVATSSILHKLVDEHMRYIGGGPFRVPLFQRDRSQGMAALQRELRSEMREILHNHKQSLYRVVLPDPKNPLISLATDQAHLVAELRKWYQPHFMVCETLPMY